MAESVPTRAADFIEQQLDQRLGALEGTFNADALCVVGLLYYGIDDQIRLMVESLRDRGLDPPHERLLVLLTTYGGYIEVVHRIVDTFRHHYQQVIFVIPNQAFSAGTVLVLSGDQIWMDYYSRLGPIDPQVQNREGRSVPANGYLRQWQRLMKRAKQGKLLDVEAALMLQRYDPAELYAYEQAGKLSVALLEEWLAKYKFKDWDKTETHKTPVTDEMKRKRAVEIAKMPGNTDRWHSHGYGISREELQREVNLKIDDLDADPERRTQVRQYDSLLSDYMGTRGLGGILHTVGHFVPLYQAG